MRSGFLRQSCQRLRQSNGAAEYIPVTIGCSVSEAVVLSDFQKNLRWPELVLPYG
jgi:hypothetical protein